MTRSVEFRRVVHAGAALFAAVLLAGVSACGQTSDAVAIDGDDIGGVVSGPDGPEAGVWVIAETMDLPTRFNRTVVTDDQGRYLIPDLPDATYDVWVRGYGLVDSRKIRTTPGSSEDLTAVVAPDPHAAAQYYPAAYWFSLIEVPEKNEFPGTGPQGNGISPSVPSQAAWLRQSSLRFPSSRLAPGKPGTGWSPDAPSGDGERRSRLLETWADLPASIRDAAS